MSIRILLADDHALVRAGFRALLEALPDVAVVAEAADGREAVRLAAQHKPDIVVMDIAMSELNGIEATGQVLKEVPRARVIVLSMHANEEYVAQALKQGASGYILKEADTAELDIAIRAVMRGETYLSPGVSRHVIGDYVRRVAPGQGALDQLTPRQREILQLVAEGHSTKDIARKLDVSVKTVETHRSQLMDRLDIHDVAGLVRFAIRTGVVSAG